MTEQQDRIEKFVDLRAPVSRVWRALTDHRQFGEWFRVAIDGPFQVGEVSTGHVTYPGYEHLRWHATVEAMEPERRFVYHWYPGAVDPEFVIGSEPPTRVEFTLQPLGGGTRVTVVESGFSRLPQPRAMDALRMNTDGWIEQMDNIRAYVDG